MKRALCLIVCATLLAGCGSTPPKRKAGPTNLSLARIEATGSGREVVMYALGLLDVGYRFGGKNPEAGLDCSGMVSFIFRNAIGLRLQGSAADMARLGRPVEPDRLKAGDLVFFNTLGRAFSHVGIYIGDDKFIHAPTSNGRIRVDSLKQTYYAKRFEAARTFLEG
ncbi:C40 family peptidase [Chitinimonas lacunae]|uniref:NlpC/P60 family protein n=1 Tax=Chitinimonas lacunae TaxID=1963018 RepID=A0ABV8MXW4_9NEIS